MPPVTAERSPPASRMTGADSPVIADSLTEATPSITSPSCGDQVSYFDQNHVVQAEARRRFGTTTVPLGSTIRFAVVSSRV